MCWSGSGCWSTSPNSSRSASAPSGLTLAGLSVPPWPMVVRAFRARVCRMACCPARCRSAWQDSSRPSGARPWTCAASFQPRLTASSRPVFSDTAKTWAASPASRMRPVGLPGVPGEPGQPLRIGHRQGAAEDPPGAGTQFVEGHRSVQVGGGVVLAGVDDEDTGSSVLVDYGQRRERVGASRGADLPHELQAADPRYLHRAAAPGELRRRQAHRADAGYLRRGGAGEADPGLLAYQAMRAVAAHEVACAQPVVAAGTADVEGDRVVMRGQRRQFVPAPDGPAEFGEPRLQH